MLTCSLSGVLKMMLPLNCGSVSCQTLVIAGTLSPRLFQMNTLLMNCWISGLRSPSATASLTDAGTKLTR